MPVVLGPVTALVSASSMAQQSVMPLVSLMVSGREPQATDRWESARYVLVRPVAVARRTPQRDPGSVLVSLPGVRWVMQR